MFNILGFKHVQSDNSIYIYSKRDVKIIILVFINNIILEMNDCNLIKLSLSLGTDLSGLVLIISKQFKIKSM